MNLKMFIPITKVDAAKRLVYGKIADEAKDHSKEVFDYTSSKPFFEAWSGDISKSTDGKSVGNVRAMHGTVAAGKLTEILFDDATKSIEGCAKIVDDNEWNKVLEGVYTGFSIGGSYEKRWKDGELTRYTAKPVEVSIVDLPCIPTAMFSVIKEGGATEMRKFKSAIEILAPTPAEVAAKAQLLATEAKADDWSKFIEPATAALAKERNDAALQKVADAQTAIVAEEPPAGDDYEQVWQSKIDGKTFKKKADMLAHNEALKAAAPPNTPVDQLQEILKTLDAKTPKAPDEAKKVELAAAVLVTTHAGKRAAIKLAKTHNMVALLPEGFVKGKVVVPEGMSKNLYYISNLLTMLASMEDMEDWYEMMGDEMDKATADRFGSLVVEFGDVIATMLDACLADTKSEEAAEAMQLSATVATLVKAVSNKKDKVNLQKAHDALSEMGANCGSASKGSAAEELTKAIGERDALSKIVSDMQPLLAEVLKRVKNIEEQPAGATIPRTLRVVGKGEDVSGDGNGDAELIAKITKMSPDELQSFLSTLAIKVAHQQPQHMAARG